MVNYWIVSWTRDNFEIYKSRVYDVAGFRENRANLAKQMKAGDRIVFHILREQLLVAICECTSGYRYDTTPIWPDSIYPHRIRTKVLAEETVDYRRIRNELELTNKGKIPPGGELKGGVRKISLADYKVIESNFPVGAVGLKPQEPAPPPPVGAKPSHNELVQLLENIGKRLDKYVERELKAGEYRHDIVWKENAYLSPSVVIEVCDSGSLEKDILSLNWASKNLKAKAILIVARDSYFEHAKRRAAQSQIVVVKAESIQRLAELVQSDLELLKAVF